MTKLTVFPPLNSITMRKKDVVLPTWRNYYHIDEASLLQGLKREVLYYPYKQKVQYTDRQNIYFFTDAYFGSGTPSVVLQIVDANGEAIVTKDVVADAADFVLSTYTYKTGDIEVETDVIMYRWRFDEGDFPEGDYYVYVQVTYGDATIEEFLSEPIWVRTQHKKTVRIDYTHNKDEHDILFGTLFPSFSIRIDSRYLKLLLKGEETTYTEQDEELRRIYGKYYRAWELDIKRMTEYLADKLGHIFYDCSNTFVEGNRCLKDAGSEIEFNRANTNAVGTGKIQLREYYQDRSGLFLNTDTIICALPSPPYLLPFFAVTNFLNSGFAGPIEIVDGTEQTAFIAWLNSVVVVESMDAEGSFAIVSGNLVYQNAADENFVLLTSGVPLVNKITCTDTGVATAAPVKVDFQQYSAGYCGYVVWDDAGTRVYSQMTNTPLEWFSVTHTFSTSGNKTFRVYSNANMTILGFPTPDTLQTGKISAISGALSERTYEFHFANQNIGGALTLSFLTNSAPFLKLLNLYSNNITSINDSWLTSSPGAWNMLKTIYMNGNAMNSAAVDDFLVKFEQYSGYGYGGQIEIKQSPAAPPTGASSAARTALIAAGWTINWV